MLNFVENLQRKSLNILEEARAIQNIYPTGASVRQAAQELKQPTQWVHVRVRLLRMPEAIQQKAAAGLLSQANLEKLAGMESADEQIAAADKIVEARQRGKGKFLPGLDRTYKRRRGVRPREEINRMIERMLAAGIDGSAASRGRVVRRPSPRRGIAAGNRGGNSRKCRESQSLKGEGNRWTRRHDAG